jgi:hypothetical protein
VVSPVLSLGIGGGINQVVLRQDALDYRRVFCTDCGQWCDLQADAEEATRDLRPPDD